MKGVACKNICTFAQLTTFDEYQFPSSIKTEPKQTDEDGLLQRSSVSLTPELSTIKSPNLAIVKKEAVTPSSSIASSTELPALAKIKKEPISPLLRTNVTDDLKIKTSSSSVNTPNRGTDISSLAIGGTPSTDRLQEAADKITLMSPDAFSSPVSSHQKIKIKKEPMSPSNQASNLSNTNVVTSNASSTLASALNIMSLASAGSSPSREVQDILAESEEQGGITADIVNMRVLNKFGFNDIPENNSFTSFSILFR